jgi:predicted nucleic acid-binding protein
VIRYLLDRDVMSQLDQPDTRRHLNVRAWLRSVPDDALYVSAITVMEAWRGFALARKAAANRPARLSECDAYESAFTRLMEAFAARVVAVDEPVAKLWGALRGSLERNQWDLGIAATAIVHDMVVATRNIADFKGRGARVVDPFHKSPTIR